MPDTQYDLMRAPFQEGDFPGPVKYGYLNVGLVEEGPDELRGRSVFCLYPHQTAYVVPAESVSVVPDDVPESRAVLAGTMETALNALWDASPQVGDRVAVVGAGMVGCCLARLLSRLPATSVTLVDVDESRAVVATALGVEFATPDAIRTSTDHDLVFHTSASSAGLQLSVDLLAAEGVVVELSWYGARDVQLGLGGAFHSRRLAVLASQVGQIGRARRDRRTYADRMHVALQLLRDEALDVLITGESAFADLPTVMPMLADGRLPALCHTVTYGP